MKVFVSILRSSILLLTAAIISHSLKEALRRIFHMTSVDLLNLNIRKDQTSKINLFGCFQLLLQSNRKFIWYAFFVTNLFNSYPGTTILQILHLLVLQLKLPVATSDSSFNLESDELLKI